MGNAQIILCAGSFLGRRVRFMTVDGRARRGQGSQPRGWSQEVAQARAVHHPGYGHFVSLWVPSPMPAAGRTRRA